MTSRSRVFDRVLGIALVLSGVKSVGAAPVSPYRVAGERQQVLGPVVTRGNLPGERPAGMDGRAAEKYCRERGFDGLPTILQLAEEMNPGGISYIRPAGFKENLLRHEGFKEILRRGDDPFYYDSRAYVNRLEADEGYWFWSRSESPVYGGLYVYVLGIEDGKITLENRNEPDLYGAVRCSRSL